MEETLLTLSPMFGASLDELLTREGEAVLFVLRNIAVCASVLKLFLREIHEQSTVEFETAKNAELNCS